MFRVLAKQIESLETEYVHVTRLFAIPIQHTTGFLSVKEPFAHLVHEVFAPTTK